MRPVEEDQPGKSPLRSGDSRIGYHNITRMSGRWNAGAIAGAVFLALQVLLILGARFTPARYFCWAPHTAQVRFSLAVDIDGRRLSPAGVQARYRFLWSPEWEAHAAYHVMDTVRRFETVYGREDGARVAMTYRVNGGEDRRWTWPE